MSMAALQRGGDRRLNIMQGECHVSDDAGLCLTTILGSCVAACLTDLVAGVGGMNHFLLPCEPRPGCIGTGAGRTMQGRTMQYGVHAMELLVDGLLQRGARRHRLQAKLFGGACMMQGLTDVGSLNAEFARQFVQRERIAMGPSSLGGMQGRRVQFWPANGRVRLVLLPGGTGGAERP